MDEFLSSFSPPTHRLYFLTDRGLTLILLITIIVVLSLFYLPIKSLILGTKCVFKHQDLQKIDLSNLTNMSNFLPFEVVGRGGETQLQVGENLNK